MNGTVITFFLVAITIQSSNAPLVRRVTVVSDHSTEIVFKYALPIFTENEPLKMGAVECFTSKLKSTGLFTDVQVDLKSTEDGQGVEISITPIWDKRRKNFIISEIDFEGFEDFDLTMLKEELRRKGFHRNVSLWKFALWEIGNMIYRAVSKTYDSDDVMMDRIARLDMPHPRFYLQVLDSINVKLTISLNRQYPCNPK